MTYNMNDHDLLITINANLNNLTKVVQSLQDGTKKDISDLFTKVDLLEKKDLSLENEIKATSLNSLERGTANALRITALETAQTAGVTKTESTKAYLWRKAFEWIMPFIFLLIGLILAKLGILNLK